MHKYCRGCGKKLSSQNKTGLCKECFGRFVLAPAGAAASKHKAGSGIEELV